MTRFVSVLKVGASLSIIAMFISCRSSHQAGVADGKNDSPPVKSAIQLPGPSLPPSICRIVGTVVLIDSAFVSAGGNDLCSKAPCIASVRIDSVLGYGSAFPYPIAPGQTLRVGFTFTLAPTGQVLPSMTPGYAGLAVGSQFKADLESAPTPGSSSSEKRFVVGAYEVR
jgi:hypothetical protein